MLLKIKLVLNVKIGKLACTMNYVQLFSLYFSRSCHGVLLLLPSSVRLLLVMVSFLHIVSNNPVEQQSVKG